MQKDKKLQSLLTKYAIQEPSAAFDDKVMQLIKPVKTTQPVFLIGRIWLRILLCVFIIASIVLFLIALFMHPQSLPVHFYIPIPLKLYTQLFSFLVAFWIVMLTNLWWNKHNRMLADI
jgi:hypothetical protein